MAIVTYTCKCTQAVQFDTRYLYIIYVPWINTRYSSHPEFSLPLIGPLRLVAITQAMRMFIYSNDDELPPEDHGVVLL